MVCRPCMLTMRSNPLLFLFSGDNLVGSSILGVKNIRLYDVWVWKQKHKNTGGMMELTCDVLEMFCLFCFESKRHILENGSNWQSVLRAVRWRKRGRFGGWHMFASLLSLVADSVILLSRLGATPPPRSLRAWSMRIPLACCLLYCVLAVDLFYFSSLHYLFSISIWTSFVSSCLRLFLMGTMLSPRFRFLLRLV